MRPTHRILTILIAGMLPFCCCSIRTMAPLVMDADTADYAGCCSGGAGTTEPGDGTDPGPEPDCSGSCCDRVAPVAELHEPLPPTDEIGTDALPTGWSGDVAGDAPGTTVIVHQPRPPDPGSGMVLERHCRRQV